MGAYAIGGHIENLMLKRVYLEEGLSWIIVVLVELAKLFANNNSLLHLYKVAHSAINKPSIMRSSV